MSELSYVDFKLPLDMVFMPWCNCPSYWVWAKSLGLISNQYNTEKVMSCHFCDCITEDCDFCFARILSPYSPHLPAGFGATRCYVGEAHMARNRDYLPANSQWGTKTMAPENVNPAKEHKWSWKQILPHASLQIRHWPCPIYLLQLCKRLRGRKQISHIQT